MHWAKPSLIGLELADFSSSWSILPVDVSIGPDYYCKLVAGIVSRGSSGPSAIHTKLSWVLSGPSSHIEPDKCTVNLSITQVHYSQTTSEFLCFIEERLCAFWEIEALGIQDEERTPVV